MKICKLVGLAITTITLTAIAEVGELPQVTKHWDIPLLSKEEVCQRINKGEKIFFVDTREKAEFDNEHLPRAINLNRHMIQSRGKQLLPKEAIIIPYCMKDFRGFAAAADLIDLGFKNVYLLKERGLQGWKHNGLPAAGEEAQMADEAAWIELAKISSSLYVSALVQGSDFLEVAPTGKTKHFKVLAKNFEFVPGELTVEIGDYVSLEITSYEGNHGVAFPDFGTHVDLAEGQAKTLVFFADKQGIFYFGCSAWCGSGHGQMKGSLIVRARGSIK